jgi:hypothetical protein
MTELEFIDFIPCLPKRKIIDKSCEMCLQVEVLFFNNKINDDIRQLSLEHVIKMVSKALEPTYGSILLTSL